MPRFEDLAAEGQALVEVGGAVVGVDVATQAELDGHATDTTDVHGIADTALLETTAGAQAKADAAEAAANTYTDNATSAVFAPVSTTYTASVGEYVLADTAGGAFTVTLPDNPADGDAVTIKNQGKLLLTVAPNTGDTIDGQASVAMLGQNIVREFVYRAVSSRWEAGPLGFEYVELVPQISTDSQAAGSNANFALRIANQITTGAARDGEHDLVLIANKNVTGLNAGADYDIRLEREAGTTGVCFINLPVKFDNDLPFQDAANSVLLTLTATGTLIRVAGTMVGDQGADDNFVLRTGSATGRIALQTSAGTTDRVRVNDVNTQITGDLAFTGTGMSGTAPAVSATSNRLDVRPGSAGLRFLNNAFNAVNLSIADTGAQTWRNGTTHRDGAGTPEGVVSAPVGSTFRRTDGGAGTTFYVKETGTGNTGWVAK